MWTGCSRKTRDQQRRRRRRGSADVDALLQPRQRRRGGGGIGRMHPRQRLAAFDALAQRDHVAEADAVVDAVAGHAPAAAEFDHGQADVARGHACTQPAAGASTGTAPVRPAGSARVDRRSPPARPAPRPCGRSAPAPSRRPALHPRAAVPARFVGSQAADRSSFGAQRRGDLAAGAARAGARRVRKSTASSTSSALPAAWPSTWFMSVISARVGSPAPLATVDQRLAPVAAPSRSVSA